MGAARVPATAAVRPFAEEHGRLPGGDDAGGLRADVPGDGRRAVRAGVPRVELDLRAPGLALEAPGPVLRRRERAPRGGRADGGAERTARCAERDGGPRFD